MRSLVVAIVLALAQGCGQKGSLYLRENPPPGVRPPTAETYKPVPYPSEPREETEAGKK
jgi:predicted small lipoprotein YifL